jgi:cytochrome c heme-lyase
MGQQVSITVLAQATASNVEKPKDHKNMMSSGAEIPPECPMHADYKKKEETTLVADGNKADINPLNMMPPANQQPAKDQPFPLPTERQLSSIPRAVPGPDGKDRWEYPSQQVELISLYFMNQS